MRSYFPVQIELKFYFINDNEDTAIVTYSFPAGKVPTEEEIEQGLKECLKEAEPMGFRYCSYEEFMNAVVSEKTGGKAGFAFSRLKDGVWWSDKAN